MGTLLGLLMVTGYALGGTTADGTPVSVGVAACPQRFAFGTVLDIEDVGIVTCHDRGPENAIDVWRPTVAECYALTGLHAVRLVTTN